MSVNPLLSDRTAHPSGDLNLTGIFFNIIRRPLFLIAVFYSVAIAYERVIEVEIFKPYRILGVILIVGCIITRRLALDRVSRTISFFLLIGFIAGLRSFSTSTGRDDIFLNAVLLWTFNIATYLAIAGVIRSRTDVIVLGVIHSVALLSASYDIALEAAAIEMGIKRAVGDFKNPANATVSMLFSGIVLVSLLRTSWAIRRLTPVLCSALKLFVPLFLLYTSSLTGTRSGAALLVAGFMLYYFMTYGKRAVLVLFLGCIVLFTVVVVAPKQDYGVADLSESNVLVARVEKKGFDTDRLYLWKSGLDALVDSLGVGVGLARYPEVHKTYFSKYAHLSDPRWMYSDLTLHNDYVSALVEHGFVGFIVFVVFCRRLFRAINSIESQALRVLGLCLLLGMAINGLTHTGLPYFCAWFYFALLVKWRTLEKRDALNYYESTYRVTHR